jgi:hypothetical protein
VANTSSQPHTNRTRPRTTTRFRLSDQWLQSRRVTRPEVNSSDCWRLADLSRPIAQRPMLLPCGPRLAAPQTPITMGIAPIIAGPTTMPKLLQLDDGFYDTRQKVSSAGRKGERTGHIYAEATSNTRHWASRDTTSSGTRIITDLSHDACSSRPLLSLSPDFAASV